MGSQPFLTSSLLTDQMCVDLEIKLILSSPSHEAKTEGKNFSLLSVNYTHGGLANISHSNNQYIFCKFVQVRHEQDLSYCNFTSCCSEDVIHFIGSRVALSLLSCLDRHNAM